MRLLPAFALAEYERLRSEYPELRQWPLRINGRLKSSLGRCCVRRKYNTSLGQYEVVAGSRRIELAPWIFSSEEQTIETIRHEAAHALAGPQHHHDAVWKSWALKLGSNATTSIDCAAAGIKVPERKLYVAACPTCGKVYRRRGKPRTRKYCRKCYRYDDSERARLHYNRRVLESVAAQMVKEGEKDA